MSVMGQKRTPFTASLYVRFTPKSGHSATDSMSAKCQQRTYGNQLLVQLGPSDKTLGEMMPTH